jgi:hypothetical protein
VTYQVVRVLWPVAAGVVSSTFWISSKHNISAARFVYRKHTHYEEQELTTGFLP